MSATAALSSYPVTYPADPVGLDDLDLDLEAEEARSWDASASTTTTTDEWTSTEEEDAEVSAESELGALVGMRRRILGPNLSLLYNEPIHLPVANRLVYSAHDYSWHAARVFCAGVQSLLTYA